MSEGSLASEKGLISALSSSLKISIKMKNIIFRKHILQQNVQMDGSINFQTNGDINVYPCPWESDKEVTNGSRVRYRAGIEVDADGRTRVKRVNDGSKGPKYQTIFETAHAVVKMTREHSKKNPNRGCLKVEFTFPKKYPLELMKQLFRDETIEVAAYLATRKTNTLWTNNQ